MVVKNVNEIPHFSYKITSQLHLHDRCIMVDGEVIHTIDDWDEFYSALGYTDKMREAGIEPELFRWSEYTKDGAVKTVFCLQAHIIAYLHKYSAMFREKYGRDYISWLRSCTPENFRDAEDCKTCIMYPK